jgi:hypothetical protein
VEYQAERRAQAAQIDRLRSEVERLKSDLEQAELALIATESSLTGAFTRAAAVRAVAEARSQLEGAVRAAPWRTEAAALARQKLDDSDEQIRENRFGAAILFASGAQRIATDMEEEAKRVRAAKDVRRVSVNSARIRSGPSIKADVVMVVGQSTPVFPEKARDGWLLVRTTAGDIGWIKASLLDEIPGSQ